MFRNTWVSVFAIGFLCCLYSQGAESKPGGKTILDATSSWRVHNTLKPPTVAADDGPKPLTYNVPWIDSPTPPPPSDWMKPDFDDSAWVRGPIIQVWNLGVTCQTPYLARLCMRGKFMVVAPELVQGLTLSLSYYGGAVIYLNGVEIARHDMSAGKVDDATLAKAYPLEAFVDENQDLLAVEGTLLPGWKRTGRPSEEALRRMGLRERSAKDIVIPPSALRKGMNVLAIEIIRSPYDKVTLEKEGPRGKRRTNAFDWNTCQIRQVRLATTNDSGLLPNAVRPEGFQAWNADPLKADFESEWGDPLETPRPITLAGARNGSYSGKVVVGSSKPIRDLAAVSTDLKGEDGAIPAANVWIRYGINDGIQQIEESDWSRKPCIGLLTEKVAERGVGKEALPAGGGAVVPIWVTVKIPRDAKPGSYKGVLNIRARDEKPWSIGINLKVLEWTLPDSQQYKTWVELIESPDTLAVEYNVPLWSDRHFELIAKSFKLMSDTGSRVVHIPAIAHTNLGNAESMIRWIKRPNGGYDWDFSVMDKYLDVAQKHLGTPKMVVLQVWDVYMRDVPPADPGERRMAVGTGIPQATLLDPATGKTENSVLPKVSDPASKAIWQGLLDKVRERLRGRGLEKTLMLGMFTDMAPSKGDIQFFSAIAPGVPWVHQGHGRWTSKIYGIAEVGYTATVWGARFSNGLQRFENGKDLLTLESLHGWNNSQLGVDFERNGALEMAPLARWHFLPEATITGDLRGFGRVGADYWPAVRGKDGRRVAHVHDRFAESSWTMGGSLCLTLCNPVLGPGPSSPEATTKLPALIEGVQESEARIAIEYALLTPELKSKLGPELAKRCEDTLRERAFIMWKSLNNFPPNPTLDGEAVGWRWRPGGNGNKWLIGFGWQAQSEKLFVLAEDVRKRLEGKR
jgi:hypothetical protein